MLQDVHAIRQRVYGLFIMVLGIPVQGVLTGRYGQPVCRAYPESKTDLTESGAAGNVMRCRCFGMDSSTYLRIPGGGSGYTVGFK
jgi:hypothetical protein